MALYAFDGTWNRRDLKAAIDYVQSPQYGVDRAAARDTVETNVSRFREFFGQDKSEYLQGVGTRFGRIGQVFGGAFGLGGLYRIRKMYRGLSKRYFEEGEHEINIVGFSRGAALAVHFANVITTHGLRNPANPRHLSFKYFPGLGWTFRHPKASADDVKAPTIDFLGLFDTVATFGWPVWPLRNRSRKWKVWTIPHNVRGTFHAMALDEVRATFALVRPKLEEQSDEQVFGKEKTGARPTLYEVWFRGAHGNIGGGYLDRGLSDIALAWMMEQAVYQWRKMQRQIPPHFDEALRMLEPDTGPPAEWKGLKLETLEPDPDGMVGRPRHLRQEAWRKLPPRSLVHHSVFLRRRNLVSDHRGTNRPLLRRVARDVRRVEDPPAFFGGTRRLIAEELAGQVFARVPVRPREWLKLDEHFIFRSDNWIALGTERGRDDVAVAQTSRQAFMVITVEWLLSGRPSEPANVAVTEDLFTHKGEPIEDAGQVCDWIVPLLVTLEPYVPARTELDLIS